MRSAFAKLAAVLLVSACAHVAPVSEARPWKPHERNADLFLKDCGFRDITDRGSEIARYESTRPCRFTVGAYPGVVTEETSEQHVLEVQMLNFENHQFEVFAPLLTPTKWGTEYEMAGDVLLTISPADSDNGESEEYSLQNVKILKQTPLHGPTCFDLPMRFFYDSAQSTPTLEKQLSDLLGVHVSCSSQKICREKLKDPNGAHDFRLCYQGEFKDLTITR